MCYQYNESKKKRKKVTNCFIDFQKTIDNIDQREACAVLQSYGVDKQLITLLKDINGNAQAAVRIRDEIGERFATNRGTRQNDPISPVSTNIQCHGQN